MENVLKILNELHKIKVGFCFQTRENYFNLKVYTPDGEEKYINSDDIGMIELKLMRIWGHLLGGTTKVIKTSAPSGVPIPPPMPPPC